MMRHQGFALATAAALIALLGFVAPIAASDAPEWAHQLPNELMSPFCPGVTLAECTSSHAGSLKMWIVVQAAAGRGEDDIREELYERYGDQIRPTPKAEGIGIAAYVLPVVVFLAGGGLVTWFLRRSTRSARVGGPPTLPLDPEVERKLDELLADEAEDR
jgi:cytochrome c-type biogenesis protein CcmH/NrfF